MSPMGEPTTYPQQPVVRQGRHGHAAVLQRRSARRTTCCGASRARSRPSPASSRRRSTSSPTSCAATGLCMDMFRQPDKVLAACEALMPHLLHVAAATADSEQERARGSLDAPRLRAVPLAGAVREVLLADAQADHRGASGRRGIQTLFYAEGRLEPEPEVRRRTARAEHRLPRRPRRHLRGPPGRAGTSSASAAASPTTCWPSAQPEDVRELLQEGDRRRRPRRRLHHGRQRHHAGRTDASRT